MVLHFHSHRPALLLHRGRELLLAVGLGLVREVKGELHPLCKPRAAATHYPNLPSENQGGRGPWLGCFTYRGEEPSREAAIPN